MVVLQAISDGLLDFCARVIAAAIAFGSWPSINSAAQPADLKRFTWSTESASEVGASIEMPLLYDSNGISIDGPTSLADSVDQVKRFKSAGWAAELIDGHDPKAIAAAITRAQKSNKPSLIACKTTIGYGAPTRAGTAKAHGEALGADELKGAKEKLGISLEPFSVPDDVLKAWRAAGSRGAPERTEWEGRMAEMGPRKRVEFERRL